MFVLVLFRLVPDMIVVVHPWPGLVVMAVSRVGMDVDKLMAVFMDVFMDMTVPMPLVPMPMVVDMPVLVAMFVLVLQVVNGPAASLPVATGQTVDSSQRDVL